MLDPEEAQLYFDQGRMHKLHRLSFFALVGLLLALGLTACQSKTALPGTSHSTTPAAQTSSPGPSSSPIASPSPVANNPAPAASYPPPKGPWSVAFKLTRNEGKSYYSGESVKVSSDGAVESASWQNGFAGAEPGVTKSQLSPEALATLAPALSDPGLLDPALNKGAGPVELTFTVNGKTTTVFSQTETFAGAPGRLMAALRRTVPTLPIMHPEHP